MRHRLARADCMMPSLDPGPTSTLLQRVSSRSAMFAMRCLGILLFVIAADSLHGEEVSSWPQFRGPDGQGRLTDVSLPRKWSEEEGIRWRTALQGLGHSTPVHDGQTIWLTTATADGSNLGVQSLDAETGELLEQIVLFTPSQRDPVHSTNSYASPSPVLHDGRLYVHYGTYGTACLDTRSSEVLWKNDSFRIEHQGGPGSSPVLHNGRLFLSLDGAVAPEFVALDAETGDVCWRAPRPDPLPPHHPANRAFSTPLIVEYQGAEQLISVAANQAIAYCPETGAELWRVRYEGFSNVPVPVADETTCYICTGFYGPKLLAIDLSGSGDVTESHVRWKYGRSVSETPSPILLDGKLYVLSNNGILTIIDAATGRRCGGCRVGGNHSASPVFANGLLYYCCEEGRVKLVDTTLESPRVVSICPLNGRIMASPAVIGRDLLIRTEGALYRVSGVE